MTFIKIALMSFFRRHEIRELAVFVFLLRPDLIAKSGSHYIIGEAKWVGQPGGNQTKNIEEVLAFCNLQRGDIRRIGIIDGFPWAVYGTNGRLIESKEAVLVQESPFDILSALLLNDYLTQFAV